MWKLIVGGIVLAPCVLWAGSASFAQKAPAPRGELHVVDKDPFNWVWITLNVFEHLMELDKDGILVPRLATGWQWLDDRTLEVKLRQGVKFHNGETFDADIVKLNWEENTKRRQPHIIGQHMNFKPGSKVEIVDRHTVRFVFPEPDGGALVKLTVLHIANRQFYQEVGWGEAHWWIIDQSGPWGTGPYKLVEGTSTPEKRSGRVVLEANANYWDMRRFPRVKRIVFDNALSQKDAVELVKSSEGRVDVVTDLSPLETLRVAQSSFATVVKKRGSLTTVFGQFNMRKTGSPWRDVRLRQALNYAINRADLVQYAAKGNGVVIPALIPAQEFGHDPNLAPYPFDPAKAKDLLREAGYPDGLAVSLIASEDLQIQATVVGRMLEQIGLKVELRILDAATYYKKTLLSGLDQPAEAQTWDVALTGHLDVLDFPAYEFYHVFALDGPHAWVVAEPALRQLYERLLQTVDREKQREIFHQMERHTLDQAYFLFLYNPIQLYAVNKDVQFVPYLANLSFAETSVTSRHWSVRKNAPKR